MFALTAEKFGLKEAVALESKLGADYTSREQ